jgi:hypothetical protein
MYRSWNTMLSFLGAGLGCCVVAVSMRTSHRMGLEVELSELERSERVAWSCFSKVHCCKCEAILRSAMVLLEKEKKSAGSGSKVVGHDSGLGDIIRTGAATDIG